MEAERRLWVRRVVWVTLIVLIGVVLLYPWKWNAPQEFRGVLRHPVLAPGGETTGVVISTPEGGYELDLKQHPEWELQLPRLRSKPVIVVGKLRIGQSIEGRQRRIIRVHSIRLDERVASRPSQ